MVLRLLLPAVLALLAACAPGPEVEVNRHTGIASVRSGVAEVARGADWRMHARLVVLRGYGRAEAALVTYVVRFDGNYPRIESAWSDGVRLPYRTGDRRRTGCGRGADCGREEAGTIPLSLTADGVPDLPVEFQLIGRRGTYTARIPERLLAQVADRIGPVQAASSSSQ